MAAMMPVFQTQARDISTNQKRGPHSILGNLWRDILMVSIVVEVKLHLAKSLKTNQKILSLLKNLNPILAVAPPVDFKTQVNDITRAGTGDKYVIKLMISFLNLVTI